MVSLLLTTTSMFLPNPLLMSIASTLADRNHKPSIQPVISIALTTYGLSVPSKMFQTMQNQLSHCMKFPPSPIGVISFSAQKF